LAAVEGGASGHGEPESDGPTPPAELQPEPVAPQPEPQPEPPEVDQNPSKLWFEPVAGFALLLLRDVRSIFASSAQPRLTTEYLVQRLKEMEDRPWRKMPGGNRFAKQWVTYALAHFEAPRRQWRVPGTTQRPWGFHLVDLEDVFACYLDPALDPGGTANVSAPE
jgi:hypothetical protein